MAILDRIKFDSPTLDALVWKFPSEKIKLGSQLIVNQSQEAVFVKGGKALDCFGPGTFTICSANIPIIHSLINIPFGGETPFSAEVWYVNRTMKRNLKWGTSRPIQVLDPKFNFPISVRAFGRWGFSIIETKVFLEKLIGTVPLINDETIEDYFAGEIGKRLSSAVTKVFVTNKQSVFEANISLVEVSESVKSDIQEEFLKYGLSISNFDIERISIPDEEQRRFQDVLGKRMEIEQISQVNVGQSYVTTRTLDVLEKAAENENGTTGAMLASGLGIGAGLGVGVPLGQQVGQVLSIKPSDEAKVADDPMEKLKKLKHLYEMMLITEDEYNNKKKDILNKM